MTSKGSSQSRPTVVLVTHWAGTSQLPSSPKAMVVSAEQSALWITYLGLHDAGSLALRSDPCGLREPADPRNSLSTPEEGDG